MKSELPGRSDAGRRESIEVATPTLNPRQLRKLVRKWTLPVVLLTVLGALVAYGVSSSLTPIYEAKGNVLVVAPPRQTTDSNLNLTSGQVTSTAAALLVEPPLLQRVINELRLRDTTDGLAKRLTATPQLNTELVDVAVRDPDPKQAARIANTLMSDYVAGVTQQNTQRIDQAGAALQAQINQLQATVNKEYEDLAVALRKGNDTTTLSSALAANTGLLSQLTLNYGTFKSTQAQNLETVSIAAAAGIPSAPASPRILLNTAIGALAGLLAALALAALLEYLDQGLHNADDVRERLGIPCLGVVPRFRLAAPAKGQIIRRGRSSKDNRHIDAASEAYRRLRTNLLFANPDTPLKCVVVTSVRTGEGKTRTSANLAVALANSDMRVLLIDADMRRPNQHRLFSKSLDGGISDLILATTPQGSPSLNGSHQTRFANLSLLTSGTIPPNPSELLASQRAKTLLRSLAAEYDMLVMDTPPADVVTDALAVAADASATVIVVEAGRTNAAQAARVIDSLRAVGANVVGVVLNKARSRSLAGYYYQYGYSESAQRAARQAGASPQGETWEPVTENSPVATWETRRGTNG